MVSALARPGDEFGGRLWQRVADIGFKAAELMLSNPLASARVMRPQTQRTLYQLFHGRKPNTSDIARGLLASREPELFGMFHRGRFGEYVCEKFLADAGNPVHRYALNVLLSGLLPDGGDPDTLGAKERAVHWFRGRKDDGYFRKLLGVDEALDRSYKVAEAIQLFVHLFSPEVTTAISSEGRTCEPQIFVFAFDQAEGRQECSTATPTGATSSPTSAKSIIRCPTRSSYSR